MENRLARLQAFIKDHPDDEFLQYAIALEYWKQGEREEALKYLEGLRDNQPEYLATFYQLGKLYEEFGQDDDALKVYEEGMNLAKTQENQKTYEELKEAYEEISDEEEF